MKTLFDLKELTKKFRKQIVIMHYQSKTCHMASSLSCIDILTILFFKILKKNDHFILSKGHGVTALYVILAQKGLIPKKHIENYGKEGNPLPEHPDSITTKGIEFSTGSLGHGLPVAVGLAYALKKQHKKGRVFILLSDGECEEGTTWESLITAYRLKLDNLIIMIDHNNSQAYEKSTNILSLEKLQYMLEQFTFCIRCDGHFTTKTEKELSTTDLTNKTYSLKPISLLFITTKGKGIKEIENKQEWHYKQPKDEEELQRFLKEIDNA